MARNRSILPPKLLFNFIELLVVYQIIYLDLAEWQDMNRRIDPDYVSTATCRIETGSLRYIREFIMTMTKQSIALFTLIAGLSAAPAMADAATGTYAFGQVTHARETAGAKNLSNGLTAGVGYRVMENIALEGAYTGLKDRKTSMSDKNMRVSALGILPVGNNVEVFGKLSWAGHNNNNNDGMAYGLGATYALDKNLAVRVDYDRMNTGYNQVNTVNRNTQHINTYSAGMQYKF
ncbi:porin [Chitinimonas sp. BJB300]|uniref:porin n=1 Tax=Chitinimonas sp. BJB300 TaxID=1559339 RepID=UPI001111EF78|nr:porin [Chitinimonas sp. BJB300]TSJ87065.1 porin family protein [Chitinimonas sp. BJB300]